MSLCSYKHSPTICSAVSQRQLACVSEAADAYNGVWVVDHIDPLVRFEMQGEKIKAADPVLIRHVETCVYLSACKNSKFKNDFGSEFEVYCYNHSTKNKSQNLALEHQGRLTADVPTKFQEENNVFFFQTADDQ